MFWQLPIFPIIALISHHLSQCPLPKKSTFRLLKGIIHSWLARRILIQYYFSKTLLFRPVQMFQFQPNSILSGLQNWNFIYFFLSKFVYSYCICEYSPNFSHQKKKKNSISRWARGTGEEEKSRVRVRVSGFLAL